MRPGHRVVSFTPGTYTDGDRVHERSRTGHARTSVFYFPPGVYYFDFANAGTHEWTINDGTARVVGGQPQRRPSRRGDGRPDDMEARHRRHSSGSGNVNFTNTANALASTGRRQPRPLRAASQTARISFVGFSDRPRLDAFRPAPPSTRCGCASRTARPNTAGVGTPTVTITSQGGHRPVRRSPIAEHTGVVEDGAPSYDVTSCLNMPTKLNSPVTHGVRPSRRADRRLTGRASTASGSTSPTRPPRSSGMGPDQPGHGDTSAARPSPAPAGTTATGGLDGRRAVDLRRRQPDQPEERRARAVRQAEHDAAGDRALRREEQRPAEAAHGRPADAGPRTAGAANEQPERLHGDPQNGRIVDGATAQATRRPEPTRER